MQENSLPDISFFENRKIIDLVVSNRGDRPVQVGSHFHFFEVNKKLDFDRKAAYGFRLAIPAGTAVRFEPGQKQEIQLVELGGSREVFGLNNLVDGKLDDEKNRNRAFERARAKGFMGI